MTNSLQTESNQNIKRVAIVGGGLVGALNACFFAKRGWLVDLFEAREDVRLIKYATGRSINLTLSTRGILALEAVGLRDIISNQGIPMYGRYVHSADGKSYNFQPYGMKGEHLFSVSRRNLNEELLTEAEKHPNVKIHFQHKLLFCKPDKNELIFEKLNNGRQETFVADLICGCDGAYSAVRQSFLKIPGFNYSQEYVEHGYLELCIMPDVQDEFQMAPNYFHLWPRGNFCMIGLANKDKTFNCTMLAPLSMYRSLDSPAKVEKLFKDCFPDVLKMIGREQILDVFLNRSANTLVSMKCTPHHFGKSVVLMGDAAHAMVPFYGQGMNCGFEDCLLLSELLNKNNDDIPVTLQEYSSLRCSDAHAICDLAMYNYAELKDLVNHFRFRLRKRIDFLLNKYFPTFWIPLFNMVTFTRIRYHEIIQRRARQDKMVRIGENILISSALIGFLLTLLKGKRIFFSR